MKKSRESLQDIIDEIFYYLHEHPEISWNEYNTTRYIQSFLGNFNCRIKTFDDCPGLIAEVGKGSPVVALRADIDALWQEVDGEYKANHSCGHDAHMAMVLGVLMNLLNMESLPEGTVRFIFQPAEEKGNGALHLVNKGIMDDCDFLFGVHLRPVQELRFGRATPGIQHGAARFIEGKIKGEDVHGARPHLGTNAIEVGAAIVQLTNGIHLNPMIPYSVKMTSFHAGSAPNIIPGNATFGLDLRAQTNEIMDELVDTLLEKIRSLEAYFNVQIHLKEGAKIAAAKIHPEAEDLMRSAITEIIGVKNTEPTLITTGGDDFHFYTIERPHVKATMLGLGCDLSPGLHHPEMTFRKEALYTGIDILTLAVKKALVLARNNQKEF